MIVIFVQKIATVIRRGVWYYNKYKDTFRTVVSFIFSNDSPEQTYPLLSRFFFMLKMFFNLFFCSKGCGVEGLLKYQN